MPSFQPIDEIPEKASATTGQRRINPDRVPLWASELATKVCSDFGVPPIPIRWRVTNRRWNTTGVCNSQRIAITAGYHEGDHKLVLLHELAHHLTRHLLKKHGHCLEFWGMAWKLYERYGIDLQYAYSRESNYRQGAVAMAPDAARPTDIRTVDAYPSDEPTNFVVVDEIES